MYFLQEIQVVCQKLRLVLHTAYSLPYYKYVVIYIYI